MIIPLGDALPRRSSNLPAGSGRTAEAVPELSAMAHRAGTLAALESAHAIPAYLVLLRVGFTMRRSLLNVRCALTAPFHPYRRLLSGGIFSVALAVFAP